MRIERIDFPGFSVIVACVRERGVPRMNVYIIHT